eukprot:GEMP01014335.1.p1 GENE.GEMP01014335.1~~GEMP01014335.1.p1  ORF type:complete len:633 (+),score=118.52 GEMP01014335.1:82-1899(+)
MATKEDVQMDQKPCTDENLHAPWHADWVGERATALGAQRLTRIRGVDLIRDPYLNKGTAFTERERDMLGLRGLLPPRIFDINQQMVRQMASFQACPTDIAKYLFLERLHNRNETLYYRFLLENIAMTMPIVYTPTVGQACTEFSSMYRSRVRGLYMSKENRENFKNICLNWPQHDVDIIVITDGSRILGLGDLGVNGMGIPIGKLALYVAAAGFMPWRTLPVMVDLGTNNEAYRNSPTYVGSPTPRPNDEDFYTIMQEIIEAIKWRWPSVIIQFEDFSNEHAFGLLERWFPKILCFNDDIQGTASVSLAGLFSSLRIQNGDATKPAGKLREQTILFLGAGSAGVGVAELIALGMYLEGKEEGEDPSKDVDYYRKNNFYLIDSRGTVTSTRGDKLAAHKIPFARDGPSHPALLDNVKEFKPTVIIGLAGLAGGSFTPEIIQLHTENCEASGKRPIIFALSNPTSKSECSAEEAYKYSNGKAIFCSGSPFGPVTIDGKTYETGQCNNMYIFPGVGFGAYICQAERFSHSMFYAVALALSKEVTVEELGKGRVFPDLNRIRLISAKVAKAVCNLAKEEGLARMDPPENGWFTTLRDSMWWPHYEDYVQ